MPRKLEDTGSKELPQWCHFTLEFSSSLNNRACQQLAKLLLLWRREGEEVEEVIEWGLVAQAALGTDNAISTLERGDRAFVPFSFPWFQYLLTIRNSILLARFCTAVLLGSIRKTLCLKLFMMRGVFQRLGGAGVRRFCPRGGHRNNPFRE